MHSIESKRDSEVHDQAPSGVLLDSPLTAVVIINWNGLSNTLECLKALEKTSRATWKAIVVDNGSRDRQAQAIATAFPDAIVVETGANTGFTGGANRGIREALQLGAQFLFFLNNDATIDPGCISELIQALEANPDAGIAGAAAFEAGRDNEPPSCGSWVNLSQMAPVGHLHESRSTEESFEVDAIDGCALMMRREVAEQLGGFDDAYFAYAEDADLCLRARARGWKCIAVPRAQLRHRVGASSGGGGSRTATHYFERNCVRLVRGHATQQERAAFLSEYKDFFERRFKIFLYETGNGLARENDLTRRAELRDCFCNVALGLLGVSGPRTKYALLESALSLWAEVRLTAGLAAVKYGSRPYARLYWKARASAPGIAAMLPLPFLNRAPDTWKPRRRDEALHTEGIL